MGAGTSRPLVATAAGCAAAWVGLVVPALRPLYDYAWFAGFGVAFLIHTLLMQGRVRPALSPTPSTEG